MLSHIDLSQSNSLIYFTLELLVITRSTFFIQKACVPRIQYQNGLLQDIRTDILFLSDLLRIRYMVILDGSLQVPGSILGSLPIRSPGQFTLVYQTVPLRPILPRLEGVNQERVCYQVQVFYGELNHQEHKLVLIIGKVSPHRVPLK